MDLKKVLYSEATTREIAIMTNAAMKRSKNLSKILYNMNIVNTRKNKIYGNEIVRDFYETSECYDKDGNVTKEGKKILEESLEKIGLSKTATLLNVMWEIIKKYR